jgi:hypothetical protein
MTRQETSINRKPLVDFPSREGEISFRKAIREKIRNRVSV